MIAVIRSVSCLVYLTKGRQHLIRVDAHVFEGCFRREFSSPCPVEVLSTTRVSLVETLRIL